MGRRAESAVGTRRRIVEATYDLHQQKGVGATTFRDIATLADVGIGTVYHHFPTYDDVIAACGEHTFSLARPPHNAIFEGLENVEDRVRILVREVFSFYRRLPTLGRIRSERHSEHPSVCARSVGLRRVRSGAEGAAGRPRASRGRRRADADRGGDGDADRGPDGHRHTDAHAVGHGNGTLAADPCADPYADPCADKVSRADLPLPGVLT